MNSETSLMDSERQTRPEAAELIALEASRLARMAHKHQFQHLAHLIDMVVLEAWREASESEDADVEAFAEAEGS
jgi:hypothetical protein